jgi:hypothetical protein
MNAPLSGEQLTREMPTRDSSRILGRSADGGKWQSDIAFAGGFGPA